MAVGDSAWYMGSVRFHVERILFDLDCAHRYAAQAGEPELAASIDAERGRLRQIAERARKMKDRRVGGEYGSGGDP